MSEKTISFSFREDSKVLIATVHTPRLEKDEADRIYAAAEKELPGQPDHKGFILDVSAVKSVSDNALGILMKSLTLVKKARNYMVLVMTEELLQDVMVRHPIMFDYYVVFHSIDDGIAFIEKAG